MPYLLPWYRDRDRFPDDPEMWGGWTAQDYTLAYALDTDDNHGAQALVAAALQRTDPDLAARVVFDSEAGCFFAHTTTCDDMRRLAGVVAELVARTHPDAVPGTFTDSPVAVRLRPPPERW